MTGMYLCFLEGPVKPLENGGDVIKLNGASN
jgi:hypothetical protein